LPSPAEASSTASAVVEIEWLKAVLAGIRRIRGEMNISPAKVIPLWFADGVASDRQRVAKFASQISFLARTEVPQWLPVGQPEPASATAILHELRVLIPLAGLIDLGAERQRIAKEVTRVIAEIEKCQTKLSRDSFVASAPAAVVEQERTRLADFTALLAGLREQLSKLQAP